jgi:SAM-dependent methyltransferase
MDAEFWNRVYADGEYVYGEAPNELVSEALAWCGLAPGASAIELAAGEGRNAVFLAEQGLRVTAVDQSATGLKKLQELAARRKVQVETLCTDALNFTEKREFDLAVVTFFHAPEADRLRLYRKASALLAPRGWLIAEWFHPDQRLKGYASGGPPDATWMPTVPELERAFYGWRVLRLLESERELNESARHRGPAALIQLCAQKPG